MQKYYSWNASTYICDNSSYLKSIVNYTVVVCYEIISVADNKSTNVINEYRFNKF